jgi:hypothetical protein
VTATTVPLRRFAAGFRAGSTVGFTAMQEERRAGLFSFEGSFFVVPGAALILAGSPF